uniref:Alpha-macroglobulin receptor-binding domain-containing protein n=1 Tax=Anas platyrhynchos TaxID=8839 RepID=A0A8B9ZID9_ANAPL
MVIMEVSLLSGFVLAPGLQAVGKESGIRKRVALVNGSHLLAATFSLQLEQIFEMKNLKPATVKVYDYYQPGGLVIPFLL